VTGVAGVPSAEELSAVPAAELAVRLAAAYRLTAGLTAQAGRLSAQVERLPARVEELERQARKDSSSHRVPLPPIARNRKKDSDRSLRERGKRRPGKQPGGPGMTMILVDDPDERFGCPPAVCCGCGADLAGAPVTALRRHQVTGIAPAPAPKITEYVAQAKECAGCGTVTAGELPAHARRWLGWSSRRLSSRCTAGCAFCSLAWSSSPPGRLSRCCSLVHAPYGRRGVTGGKPAQQVQQGCPSPKGLVFLRLWFRHPVMTETEGMVRQLPLRKCLGPAPISTA